jgi:hypothetical protein
MTTKSDPRERRLLVNLSVVAGSAAMLAASWLGVVGSDRASSAAEGPVTTASEVVRPTGVTAEASALLMQAPAPAPRRVIVTRQSRAS